MFSITKKDKKEILEILLAYNCKCKMNDLVKQYSYLNDKKNKRAKIREVIKKLNKEPNQKIKLQIVESDGYVKIYFEQKGKK